MEFDRLAKSYLGTAASEYENGRMRLAKWKAEQRIVEHLLAAFPAGSTVIDVPVGTGRFIPAYANLGFKATGMDISPDMISMAARKAEKLGLDMLLRIGDIRFIDAAADSFDICVCICFLNWIDIGGAKQAFRELVRVTGGSLIVGIRHYTPLNELNLFSLWGWGHFFLQMATRLYKLIDRSGLRVHEKSAVQRMFREHNLRLVEETRVVPRKFGTDYFIYALEKQCHPGLADDASVATLFSHQRIPAGR